MGQKDLAAKELESKPEVFADIINAFLYGGKQVVLPECLKPAPTETLYESTYEVLRNQYNDVSKYEMAGQKIDIQYVLENESKRNYRLIMRKAGYEGAIYRSEYEEKHVYPVIILVLYWGRQKWNPCVDLHSFFGDNRTVKQLGEYIDNIKLHVFSMAHLPKEIRKRFRSDLRIIVDYLAEGSAYEPTCRKITYVGPVMRLLYALTGEREFLNSIAELAAKQERGDVTMCEVVDKFVAIGRKQGIQQGLYDGARAFVEASIDRGAATDYILEMVQQCFRFSREDADALYRECQT